MRNLLMDIQYQKPPIYSIYFRFPLLSSFYTVSC